MKSKIAVALVATCVVFASCGGDDSGSGDGLSGAVSDALELSMSEDDMPFEITDENVSCITEKLLEDEETNAALQAAYDEGKTGEDLLDSVDGNESTEAKATLMTFQCLSVEQVVDVITAEIAAEGDVTEDQRQCLIDEFEKLTADELANGFAALVGVSQDQAAAEPISNALMTCFEGQL